MNLSDFSGIEDAQGLSSAQRDTLHELIKVYEHVSARNRKLRAYYEGTIRVKEFGLTIDSTKLRNDQVCFWPQKAVESLAERVRFDKFVLADGTTDPTLDEIVRKNNLINAYSRYQPSKYMHGCMFAAINRMDNEAQIRFHSAETAAAIPDGNYDSGLIGAGFVIARRERTTWSNIKAIPTVVNLYEPGRVTVITRTSETGWSAQVNEIPEEQPMMVAFTHKSTGTQPFGQSRINRSVRSLTRDAVRTMWRMELSGAFYSIPQRYIIGLSDDMYDAIKSDKARQYLDSLFLATRDDEGAPTYGQLSGNSPQPFIDQLRALAAMFSGATGVPLNSLGIVQDNPSSADAIMAAREDICVIAENDIGSDQVALERVAQLAMAIANNTTVDKLSNAQKSVMAYFKKPMLASWASLADAATKISGPAPWFPETDVYWEQQGFDAATIARIKADRKRAQATSALEALAALPEVQEEEPESLFEEGE